MKMECRRRKRLFLGSRFILLAAAVSLAIYIPFKYATQLHAISGSYAFLFPLSSVVALAGILLAVRPGLAFQSPLWLRSGVSVIAIGWMATGLMCIPSLAKTTMASPFAGLFATFHMSVQHVVLSVAVAGVLLAPHAAFGFFGITPEESPKASKAAAPSELPGA